MVSEGWVGEQSNRGDIVVLRAFLLRVSAHRTLKPQPGRGWMGLMNLQWMFWLVFLLHTCPFPTASRNSRSHVWLQPADSALVDFERHQAATEQKGDCQGDLKLDQSQRRSYVDKRPVMKKWGVYMLAVSPQHLNKNFESWISGSFDLLVGKWVPELGRLRGKN